MSKPTNLSWDALKRLGRFLLARKRFVFKYEERKDLKFDTEKVASGIYKISFLFNTSKTCNFFLNVIVVFID